VGKGILAFLEDEELNAYFEGTKFVPYTPKTIIQRKHILKELEETRLRGYSIDRGETVLGLACIGAPIFGRGGQLEGSISLSGDSDRILGKQVKGLARELIKTAGEISRSMGYFPESFEGIIIQRSRNVKSQKTDIT
jgi:DNA-binding IclR family transcriptional regulator